MLGFETELLPPGLTAAGAVAATVTLGDDDTVEGAPSVATVAMTSEPGPDGTYELGDRIEATVRFDKSVTVTGTPQLGLAVGGVTRQMLHSGGGGDVLTFSYAVLEGDCDPDGVSIAANSLWGVIRDSSRRDAGLAIRRSWPMRLTGSIAMPGMPARRQRLYPASC